MASRAFAILALAASHAFAASGDWKPDKTVEIIVNTAPGASPDRTGRAMQRIFQERRLVEVPVTVSNRVGGGGAIAYTYLGQRGADAHFIAIASKLILASHIQGRGPYHGDFTPLAHLFGEYAVIGVRADSPIKSGRDLVERLRKDPTAYWERTLARMVEQDEWKKDVETNHLAADFLGSADTRKLMDSDYVKVKAFLTELELVK